MFSSLSYITSLLSPTDNLSLNSAGLNRSISYTLTSIQQPNTLFTSMPGDYATFLVIIPTIDPAVPNRQYQQSCKMFTKSLLIVQYLRLLCVHRRSTFEEIISECLILKGRGSLLVVLTFQGPFHLLLIQNVKCALYYFDLLYYILFSVSIHYYEEGGGGQFYTPPHLFLLQNVSCVLFYCYLLLLLFLHQ